MLTALQRHSTLLSVLALCAIGIASGTLMTHAGPVTNSSPIGQAPFTKLGVYKKVLGLVDATTNATLQFGANGQDILGSSDVTFRPGNAGGVTTNGVQFKANGSSTDVFIPGDLCLYDHTNGTNLKVCNHTFSGGAGVSKWTESNDISVYGTYHLIEPLTLGGESPSVHLGGPVAGLLGQTALTLTGTGSNLDVSNYSTGYAAQFEGNLVTNIGTGQYFTVNGRMYIRPSSGANFEPWYNISGVGVNEGTQSQLRVGDTYGLDADLADGNQVTIESAASCTDGAIGAPPRVACLCFFVGYTEQVNSTIITTPATVTTGGVVSTTAGATAVPEKHCTPLANRY